MCAAPLACTRGERRVTHSGIPVERYSSAQGFATVDKSPSGS
jgi:hypothetical protein